MPASEDLGALRRSHIAAARLYLVCDARPPGGNLETLLRAAVAGGVDVVQRAEP